MSEEAVPCDGRPVIIQLLVGTEWECIEFVDKECKNPVVHGCVHEAIEALDMIFHRLVMSSLSKGQMPKIPQPQELRFIYVDEEPEYLDEPVSDTSTADSVIRKLMEAK